MSRPKQWQFSVLMTEHAFDKIVELDVTLSELRAAMAGHAEVVEQIDLEDGVKEVVLLLDFRQALHMVVVVDSRTREERVVTIYEPGDASGGRPFEGGADAMR